MKRRACPMACLLALPVCWAVLPAKPADTRPADLPRAHDRRMEVRLFAAAPDIVHPVSIDFDARGRLHVIESHTHFRPANYKGPKFDRIRILEDTDGDGKADRFTTFHEGTQATMDVAGHPDGSVYIATRNEILRLRDTKGDGKADEVRRIVFLDTKGNYPHNGLSGLAFDSKGDLYFGMGENLGADYKLIGSDGTTLSGGGEGGNVFWCTADGKKPRRVATGFWNPFGACRDIFGRTFAVDNDPDAMPPCRMMQVVEGGDHGYQFRYGRSGRHPFQSWDGQLPGTLPMVSGTGEAPCEIVSYESDGLPREYLGNLLVASWADHRIERYELEERGASFTAKRKPFIQGGKDFRPVGIATALDGSLFISDWVKSDYNLHGHGAVWHIRWTDAPRTDRPKDPRQALLSGHRPLREAAARQLAAKEEGREFLREQLGSKEVRIRAASLTALLDAGDQKLDLNSAADRDAVTGLRAMAVRALVERGKDATRFLDAKQPAEVQLEAIASLKSKADLPQLLKYLASLDPFLFHAAVRQLSRFPSMLAAAESEERHDPRQRIGMLLAWRASGHAEAAKRLAAFLDDVDDEVRFLAAKWIADEKLTEYRTRMVKALEDRKLNVRLFFAYSSALARLDGKDVNESRMADYFVSRLSQNESPAAQRVMALRMVPAGHPKLTVPLLSDLLRQDDVALQLEAGKALAELPASQRFTALREAARYPRLSDAVRAQAIVGLSERSPELLDELLALVRGDSAILGDEALRALVGVKLNEEQRKVLEEMRRRPGTAALVARVLGKPFTAGRPSPKDVDAWLKRLEGPADPEAGRRVFFHPKLASCSRCHRVDGRGQDVGPDLSIAGRNERRRILESVLQPSASVAPHYQVWQLEMNDGKVHNGMLLRTYLDEYTYLDIKGNQFKVNTRDIGETRPLPTSIMPDGLADLLTDQELRDLMAYLCSRR